MENNPHMNANFPPLVVFSFYPRKALAVSPLVRLNSGRTGVNGGGGRGNYFEL
jgi:hypothetical protein